MGEEMTNIMAAKARREKEKLRTICRIIENKVMTVLIFTLILLSNYNLVIPSKLTLTAVSHLSQIIFPQQRTASCMAVCRSPLANQFRKPPEQFNINRDRLVMSILLREETLSLANQLQILSTFWNEFNSEWSRMNGCPPPLWFTDTELVGKPPPAHHKHL